jgi:hypothetical protein
MQSMQSIHAEIHAGKKKPEGTRGYRRVRRKKNKNPTIEKI